MFAVKGFNDVTTFPTSTMRMIVAVGIIGLLSACSSTGREVPESKKDPTGQFDGRWKAAVQKAPSPQFFGNTRVTCGGGASTILFAVVDSKLSISLRRNDETKIVDSYVGTKGEFRISFPSGVSFGSTVSSGVHHTSREAPLILSGNLSTDSLKGKQVLGIPALGFRGCTSDVTFSKETG